MGRRSGRTNLRSVASRKKRRASCAFYEGKVSISCFYLSFSLYAHTQVTRGWHGFGSKFLQLPHCKMLRRIDGGMRREERQKSRERSRDTVRPRWNFNSLTLSSLYATQSRTFDSRGIINQCTIFLVRSYDPFIFTRISRNGGFSSCNRISSSLHNYYIIKIGIIIIRLLCKDVQ